MLSRHPTAATLVALLAATSAAISLRAQDASPATPARFADWPRYGGTPENNHYSALAQINRENVGRLQVAWQFDTGEEGGLQTTPIIVHGVLYGITPTQKIFALDAATGKPLWKFDSGIVGTQPDRGLTFWQSPSVDGAVKDARILVGVLNYLYALDAATGKPVATFGDNGRIDLRENLGREPASANSIYLTSPGVVFEDLIIVGGRMPETLPAPPGDVRAFDVRTGKLRWAFHTIPRPGEAGYETWPKDAWKTSGAANNWTGMALDSARGIVYVPTGSAASDFYGTDRAGDNLYANCLLALDARTGKRLWHFQAVHHDLWDRDFPSPPVLLTVQRDGQSVAAVAQTSKQGFVYLFNRSTGKPLFPLETKAYPASTVPGENAAKEQSLPTKPAPFARQLLTEDMLTERTPEAHRWALENFKLFRSEGQFVPLSTRKETIVFPGFDGAAEWGGPAVDPQTGVIYINSNEMAWNAALGESTDATGTRALYTSQCSICHHDDLKGAAPDFPSLDGIGARLTFSQIAATIHNGKGRMPGFPNLTPEETSAIADFLVNGRSVDRSAAASDKEIVSSGPQLPAMKYHLMGYNRFLDPDGYPAIAPPWGTLNAINLNTGEYLWKIPFGEYPELTAAGMKDTGSENYGGPVVTAGGLLFIGASNFDKKFRAYNSSTGALLWETTLPFSGNATPATYSIRGRQFVVIAAGGGKDRKSKSGGVYVAFFLPDGI
ncbi:MAG TPA: PQQ-binding-like beta-propeller repeat protein [Candidatus Acidoferrum sp.]|nr:PQQ-binding-like beta-propeller repeat protein [Candidatus Acidoferrum sp.]